MDFFYTKNFFELNDFENKQLFENTQILWTVLSKITRFFKDQNFNYNKKEIPKSCYLENSEKIYIGEKTLIEPYTYIKGPCYIGKNCQIRQGAYIRENVITGNNCIIGHCSEIKNSILLNNVCASHFAYIGDSILGNNVNLGAGVKCANFRLDKENICFYFKNKKIKTDLKKFGSIIGDNCQIGCNTVLNPATFLEKNVRCYANLNFGGFIKANSIVKQIGKIKIQQFKKLKIFTNEHIDSGKK